MSNSPVYQPENLLKEQLVAIGATVIPFLGFVGAVIYGYMQGVSIWAFVILFALYAVNFFGITIGYHRLFTHRGFETFKLVKVGLALAGAMAIQGPLNRWVANHRRHHAFSDKPGDPHSPHAHGDEGFIPFAKGVWHAHIGWLFDREKTVMHKFAADILKDKTISRIDRFYGWWIVLSLLVPTLLGWGLIGGWQGALEGLLWGGFARLFLVYHVSWSVNSICHIFGSRPYKTSDKSRNNFIMGIIAFGEGWHNNHHKFPGSVMHGLRWWQIDFSGYFILMLEKLGLAWGLKRISREQVKTRER